MKKLLSLYNRIFKETLIDKQLHFSYGFMFNTWFYLIILVWPFLRHNLRIWEIAVISLVITTILIGVGREIAQRLINDKSQFDWQDVKVTMYGAAKSSAILTLALYILLWTCAELKF